jgi:hypothetical protein
MSLDRAKLQKVRDLASGGLQAQCPACAEVGQDRKGEHLRISPEGKFGCCVFAGDRKHRSRIFALAGERGAKAIKVRVASVKTAEVLQLDLLGRLGRVFQSQTEDCKTENATSGTLGTTTYSLRVREESETDQLYIRKLIDNRQPVPSVPVEVQHPICQQSETGVPTVPVLPGQGNVQLPYLNASGDLVIPFNSPERYHWWKEGGQSIDTTKQEILQRKENDASAF